MALTVTALGRSGDSHEYVLSRPPDHVEAKALRARLREDCALRVTFLGGETVQVEGLTAENRAGFENVLRARLIQANAAHTEAALLARGGEEWTDQPAAEDAEAAAAVKHSFADLPKELP
jgi:hypothetical protein